MLLKAVPLEDFTFHNSEVQALACHLVAFQTHGLSFLPADPLGTRPPKNFPWDPIIYLY